MTALPQVADLCHRPRPRRASLLLIVCSIAALVWMLAARMVGPSDATNQTQPKTTAYTTDILVNGRWILPVERGELPATKPPLYNWLAAPAVKLLGFGSEIGHRFPSILAMCLCWLAVVRVGRAIDCGDGSLGWLAGMIVPASYTLFKLGYLARPDMLLTLWLLLGWCAATALLVKGVHHRAHREHREGEGCGGEIEEREIGPVVPPAEPGAKGGDASRTPMTFSVISVHSVVHHFWLALAFWLCVGLAGLTKGPPAAVLVIYALLGSRAIGGSWRATRIFGWWWGLPLALAMVGAWLYAAWRVNPGHVYRVMWHEEIWGRVTGLGPEGNRDGPKGWVKDFFNQGLYYIARFAPWSVLSVLAAAELWRKGGWRRVADANGAWLHGAAVFVVVVIGLFTLSTGKRADYIAAAFPPGALLAAWWLRRAAIQLGWNPFWPAAAGLTVVLSTMTIVNQLQLNDPSPDFDRSILDFASEAREAISRDPRPVVFYQTGTTHMKAYMGYSEPDLRALDQLHLLAASGRPFWVIAGRDGEVQFDEAIAKALPELAMRAVIRSPAVPQERGWPSQMTLFEARQK